MSGDKRRRLTVAITVGATLLVLILFAVAIYQIVQIVVVNGRIKDMDEEIESLRERQTAYEDDMEYLKTEEYLREELLKRGYSFD